MLNANHTTHRLTIITPHADASIVADEDHCKAALQKWKDWCENSVRNEHGLLEVEGFEEAVSRRDRVLVTMMADISAIYVMEIR